MAPSTTAGPTAEWTGTTPTLVCAAGRCQILSPPVDDSSVVVGTGKAKQLRLTLTSDEPLQMRIGLDAGDLTTPAANSIRTKWLPAPADGTLAVDVLDTRYVATGLRPGAMFTLVAEYR